MVFNENDLIIERLRRSGPGGQHRNRKATGIRLIHLPTGITVMATERRSQASNLEAALQRLEARLQQLQTPKKPRKKSSVPKRSKENRLQKKKFHSQKKNLRRKIPTLHE